MNRLLDWDDDSITVTVIPQACSSCGERNDKVRLSLEAVVPGTSDFVGVRTVGKTLCCGGEYRTAYPAVRTAVLLEHLKDCPRHQKSIENLKGE
jgi:hypothetical protein